MNLQTRGRGSYDPKICGRSCWTPLCQMRREDGGKEIQENLRRSPIPFNGPSSFIAKLAAGAAFGAMRRANDLVARVPRDILDRILGCHSTCTN